MNIPPKIKHSDASRAEVSRALTCATDTPAPWHSPLLMNTFLKALDPSAKRFTLQCFRDPKNRKNEKKPDGLRLVHHCTPDEAVALVREWNTPEHGYGFYITVNETDLSGRARENIIRARAVYVDVDEAPTEVVARLKGLLAPSAIIKSSTGHLQIYWWVDETFQLDQFEPVQRALIAKLGTDPQVHDLPRVMRLPGSLHLKGEPQLVTMKPGNNRRHSADAIIEGLGLKTFMGATTRTPPPTNILAFPPRPPILGSSELSAGIELPGLDTPRLRSAYKVLALAGKMAGRDGWRDLLLFPLTELAKLRSEDEPGWKALFDEISALAGGDTSCNEAQWNSSMSSHVSNPRTVGSVFAAAQELGWSDPVTVGAQAQAGSSVIGTSLKKPRATIYYVPGEIARAADEAEAALIGGGAKAFRRGSNLVRPEFVETTGFKGRVTHQALLRPATVPMLVRMLSQVAIFMRPTKDGDKPTNPPEAVARGILAGQDGWPFPSVAGVITSPTLRPDGSILATEGCGPPCRSTYTPDTNHEPLTAIAVPARTPIGPVAGLVGIEGGVVSGVMNLESSGRVAGTEACLHLFTHGAVTPGSGAGGSVILALLVSATAMNVVEQKCGFH